MAQEVPPNSPKARAVCLPMLKGGFGKSVFASTLGGVLGDLRGHNVLVHDLDPAGHLSTGLGYYTREDEDAVDLGDVLLDDADPADIIKHPGYGFDFIPSMNLESVAEDLSRGNVMASDRRLQQDLVDPLLGDEYDYILFDIPGSRNKLVNNAVVAAPNAILPMKPVPEALNGMRETATKLIGPIRQHFDFEILAAVPNDLRARIDHETKDRRLLEAMNTDEHFASYLLAGRDGVNPGSENPLPDDVDVDEVLDDHIPPFARVTEDEWAAIDAGEMVPPKVPIRHNGAFGDAYEARKPVTAHDPECNQIPHFEELAKIVEQGGIRT